MKSCSPWSSRHASGSGCSLDLSSNSVWSSIRGCALIILMIYVLTETADIMMSVILKAAHRQRQDAFCLAFNLLTNIVLNLALSPFWAHWGRDRAGTAGSGVSATLRHLLIAQVLESGEWFHFARKTALISLVAGSVVFHCWMWSVQPGCYCSYTAVSLVSLWVSSSFSFQPSKHDGFPSAGRTER